MADLENSKRSLERATYTPPEATVGTGEQPAETGRAWEKWSFVTTLAAEPNEWRAAIERISQEGLADQAKRLASILSESEVARADGLSPRSLPLEMAQRFADIDTTTIRSFGRAMIDVRNEAANEQLPHAAKKRPSPRMEKETASAIRRTRDLQHFFERRVAVRAVGYLHLERLSFVPAGIERGELLYSVPLSPGEEVNISHKEWAKTSQDFERIVTDYLETYSEQGVAEKSELSDSTTTQAQHTNSFNLGVTASVSYGPVSVSASTGYSLSDSSSVSAQTSRKDSSELTKKASSRVKKEHKTTFKVSSASGTEDQAVRKIKNPFADRATRVDYYQLVRKWRVDLSRYGVRLTYDIVVPEPGLDVLNRIVEIQALESELQDSFGSRDARSPLARFDLRATDVTRENYQELAAEYQVALESPPRDSVYIDQVDTKSWSRDQAKTVEFHSMVVDVPEGYVFSSTHSDVEIVGDKAKWEDDFTFWFQGPERFYGRGGRHVVVWRTWNLNSAFVRVMATARLTAEAFQTWQMRAWHQLQDAARTRYELSRGTLQERLAKLRESLGATDSLSLRQMEREEVMKAVLRWLFGPHFTFAPNELPANPFGPNQTVVSEAVQAATLAQGEVIKFLHHAIEWENMIYFLYPYFWSHTDRWETKKHLDHPDLLHRAFLRAGAARVVLPIRPGYEKSFVSFYERGVLAPAEDAPYLTIAREVEAFAQTNYPGVPTANQPTGPVRPLLTPLQRKAWAEMEQIIVLLERYKSSNGSYPTTSQGLEALDGIGAVSTRDPWGNPYVYRAPGQYTDFELVSYGANGVPGDGNAPDEADIMSWADTSLIGRWYEYTPTPALDLSFNETLPTG